MPARPVVVPPLQIDMDVCAWDRVQLLADRLAVEGAIYTRGGVVVQPPRVDTDGRLDVRQHTPETVAAYASRWITYARRGKKGDMVEAPFPRADAMAMLAIADLPERVPAIDHVYGCPIMLPDGGILATTGYHADTRSWCTSGEIPITDMGTEEAVDVLWRLVDQVPMVGGRTGPAFGAIVAAMLTPILAHIASGPAPMLVIDANVQGAGKSRLAQIILRCVFGRPWPTSPMPTGTETSEKRLTTLAMSGTPAVLIDNVRGVVRSTELEAALTSEMHSDRLLGGNRQVTVRWCPLWIMTSNNARLNTDMTDRIMLARLHTDSDSPRQQGGWRIPDIGAHIDQDRARIVSALVALPRAAITRGWPSPPLGSWGSFESWSRHVLSAIHCAGLADPREGREDWISDVDVDRAELSAILEAWPAGGMWSASDIEDGLTRPQETDIPSALLDALREVVPRPYAARSIGHVLSRWQNKPCGGRALVMTRTKSRRVWSVDGASEAALDF